LRRRANLGLAIALALMAVGLAGPMVAPLKQPKRCAAPRHRPARRPLYRGSIQIFNVPAIAAP
jgi:hypothetical protein